MSKQNAAREAEAVVTAAETEEPVVAATTDETERVVGGVLQHRHIHYKTGVMDTYWHSPARRHIDPLAHERPGALERVKLPRPAAVEAEPVMSDDPNYEAIVA